MMELVADESVDYRIITTLRGVGIGVYAIIDERPTINDTSVLQTAVSMEQLLITQDKDFGELVFRLKLPHCGVLLIRLSGMKPEDYPWLAQTILLHFEQLKGGFAVFTSKKLRFHCL